MKEVLARVNINIGLGSSNPHILIHKGDDLQAIASSLVHQYCLPAKAYTVIISKIQEELSDHFQAIPQSSALKATSKHSHEGVEVAQDRVSASRLKLVKQQSSSEKYHTLNPYSTLHHGHPLPHPAKNDPNKSIEAKLKQHWLGQQLPKPNSDRTTANINQEFYSQPVEPPHRKTLPITCQMPSEPNVKTIKTIPRKDNFSNRCTTPKGKHGASPQDISVHRKDQVVHPAVHPNKDQFRSLTPKLRSPQKILPSPSIKGFTSASKQGCCFPSGKAMPSQQNSMRMAKFNAVSPQKPRISSSKTKHTASPSLIETGLHSQKLEKTLTKHSHSKRQKFTQTRSQSISRIKKTVPNSSGRKSRPKRRNPPPEQSETQLAKSKKSHVKAILKPSEAEILRVLFRHLTKNQQQSSTKQNQIGDLPAYKNWTNPGLNKEGNTIFVSKHSNAKNASPIALSHARTPSIGHHIPEQSYDNPTLKDTFNPTSTNLPYVTTLDGSADTLTPEFYHGHSPRTPNQISYQSHKQKSYQTHKEISCQAHPLRYSPTHPQRYSPTHPQAFSPRQLAHNSNGAEPEIILNPDKINLAGLSSDLLTTLQHFFEQLDEKCFDQMTESFFVDMAYNLGFQQELSALCLRNSLC